jgi:putative tryptophan/tyrosine transport system substrate-binding protein
VSGIRRREFVILLGGSAAAAWPLAARAQQAAMPVIGFLGPTTASFDARRLTAFVERLRQLGWIEGRNVTIEYRWAEGRADRASEIAAEFVRSKVDVIVTGGTANVVAAMQATSVIPIVIIGAGDPVGMGLVASLARPGGNVTGLSIQSSDLAGKQVELLREVVPSLRRLAILANAGSLISLQHMREAQAAASALGIKVVTLEVRRAEDIAPVFQSLKGAADALLVTADPLLGANRIRINILALSARLPTIQFSREYLETGGFMFFGPNFVDVYRRGADYVDKILRGAKPADIPVEQPTKFELVVNLIAAQALGLEVPPSLLARADEVIE